MQILSVKKLIREWPIFDILSAKTVKISFGKNHSYVSCSAEDDNCESYIIRFNRSDILDDFAEENDVDPAISDDELIRTFPELSGIIDKEYFEYLREYRIFMEEVLLFLPKLTHLDISISSDIPLDPSEILPADIQYNTNISHLVLTRQYPPKLRGKRFNIHNIPGIKHLTIKNPENVLISDVFRDFPELEVLQVY